MKVSVILKNGVKFDVRCKKFEVLKGENERLTGFRLVVPRKNMPLFIAPDQIAAIVSNGRKS